MGFRHFPEVKIDSGVSLNRSEKIPIAVFDWQRITYCTGSAYNPPLQTVCQRLIVEDSLQVEVGMAGEYVIILCL